jgi:2-octaprenylphenol hydroxylase
MNFNRYDAAVVGTGIVGLATALGFAQGGMRVALMGLAPRAHVPGPNAPFDPRIYAVAPASADLLERLGVWARIDPARVCRVERMRVFGDAGDELTFDAYAASVERLATIVEESELLRVLDAACGFQPLIERVNSAFRALTDVGGGVRLELDDGIQIEAALLVGADGAQSAVRAATGIGAEVKPYRQTAVVINLRCERPHLDTAWQWFTAEGVVALLPLPGQHVSLVWSAPDSVAELPTLTPAALAERVTERTQHALGTLTAWGASATFPLRLIKVERIVGTHVALVGDAAHVVHPLAGQGLNLGLQDVARLLQLIVGRPAFRGAGDPVLLRRYERSRAEAVSLMRYATDGLSQLFAIDDPLVRRVRNTGMTVVNRLKPLKRLLIRHALG